MNCHVGAGEPNLGPLLEQVPLTMESSLLPQHLVLILTSQDSVCSVCSRPFCLRRNQVLPKNGENGCGSQPDQGCGKSRAEKDQGKQETRAAEI